MVLPAPPRRLLLGGALALPLATPALRHASAAPTKVQVGGLAQSQVGLVLDVLKAQSFDRRHDIAVDSRTYPTLDGVFTAIRGAQVDIGSGGWTAIAQFRSRNIPVVMFMPVGRGISLDVVVRKDLPVQSLADLKDKRIGSFAGAAGTGTVLLRVLTKNFFGYDPAETGRLQFAGPGLLPPLVEKGELDAALLFDPIAARSLLTGRFRSIGNLAEIYRDKVGEEFLWIGYSTNDAFARQNPEALRGFARAWQDAVAHVRANPQVYVDYITAQGFDASAAATLAERMNTDYVQDWNAGTIATLRRFAGFARAIMGPGYLDQFVEAAFTTEFYSRG